MEQLRNFCENGSLTAAGLARTLGVAPATVTEWCNGRRPVPVQRCIAIERATQGAVTRRDLRPDDWHLIWPELADSQPNSPSALVDQGRGAVDFEQQAVRHG